MHQLRSFAVCLIATGVVWACGGNANNNATGSARPLAQQPAGNPLQPSPNVQQPPANGNQPPSSTQPPTNSQQPPGGGLDCGSVCAQIAGAGCDAITGQCAARCALTHTACATEIQAILTCIAGSRCNTDGNFSDTCQGTYDTYQQCESRVVGGGGSAGSGNGAGGDGASGNGSAGGPSGGSSGGGTCTQQGDQCVGCTTTCDTCVCVGLTPAQCGC